MSPTSTQLNAYYADQGTGVGVLKDALGNVLGVGIAVPAGAAANNVLVSDANGNLTNQALPAAGVPATLGTTTFSGAATFNQSITVPEGSNAYMGTVAVNGTTAVTVSTTAVTGTSRIFLTTQVPGGTVATSYVSSTSAATYFTVKSTGATDSSTVAWLIVDPA